MNGTKIITKFINNLNRFVATSHKGVTATVYRPPKHLNSFSATITQLHTHTLIFIENSRRTHTRVIIIWTLRYNSFFKCHNYLGTFLKYIPRERSSPTRDVIYMAVGIKIVWHSCKCKIGPYYGTSLVSEYMRVSFDSGPPSRAHVEGVPNKNGHYFPRVRVQFCFAQYLPQMSQYWFPGEFNSVCH